MRRKSFSRRRGGVRRGGRYKGYAGKRKIAPYGYSLRKRRYR